MTMSCRVLLMVGGVATGMFLGGCDYMKDHVSFGVGVGAGRESRTRVAAKPVEDGGMRGGNTLHTADMGGKESLSTGATLVPPVGITVEQQQTIHEMGANGGSHSTVQGNEVWKSVKLIGPGAKPAS
jgi:hypothetical protein